MIHMPFFRTILHRRPVWTARRTWWATLVTVVVVLLPLAMVSVRVAPCLLSAIIARPAGTVGTRDTSGAGVFGVLPCRWSWQSLICVPLAQLANGLHWLPMEPGSGQASPAALLLTTPALAALLLSALWLIRATGGFVWSVICVGANMRTIDRLALPVSHAASRRVATVMEAASVSDLSEVSGRSGISNHAPLRIRILDDARPYAWTAGLWRPTVTLSVGLLTRLDDTALAAVLAHEAAHVRRRDPLRRLVSKYAACACPYVPALRALAAHLRLRQEVEADQLATTTASSAAVARALMCMVAVPSPGAPAGVVVTSADTTILPVWRLRSPAAGSPTIESNESRTPGVVRYVGARVGWVWRLSMRWTSGGRLWAQRRGRDDAPRNGRSALRTTEASSAFARRVDDLLGHAPAGDLVIPTATVMLSMLGLVTIWCLLGW